jgi:hypothetical protein
VGQGFFNGWGGWVGGDFEHCVYLREVEPPHGSLLSNQVVALTRVSRPDTEQIQRTRKCPAQSHHNGGVAMLRNVIQAAKPGR